jgi:hypothetical protein
MATQVDTPSNDELALTFNGRLIKKSNLKKKISFPKIIESQRKGETKYINT